MQAIIASKTQRQRHFNAEQRAEWIFLYHSSQLSQEQFAQQNGLKLASSCLTAWSCASVRQPLRRGCGPCCRFCVRHVESLERHAHLRSPGTGGSAPEF